MRWSAELLLGSAHSVPWFAPSGELGTPPYAPSAARMRLTRSLSLSPEPRR